MSDAFQRRLQELTDEEHELLYGPHASLEPGDAATLLSGFDKPWWIIGGWAIEAFTGAQRPHHDVDVAIMESDVPALIDHCLPRYNVWAVGSGLLQPYLTADQPTPEWSGQIWIRKDASSPWLLDFNVAPVEAERWVFKRDTSVKLDLEDTLWTAPDGVRYQRPELVLAFKASNPRPQDDADLARALPLLDPPARMWLDKTISRLYPDHRWLDLISESDP